MNGRVRTAVLGMVAASLAMVPARAQTPPPAASPTPAEVEARRVKEERRLFQAQELIPARAMGYLVSPGESPRIVWRDLEEVQRLGSDGRLKVRWFDTSIREADRPDHPGRWAAYVEGRAPNGTPVRRSMTFYARPPMFLTFYFPSPGSSPFAMPQAGSAVAPDVWDEHRPELERMPAELMLRAVNDSQSAVATLAGLMEMKPLGRPARSLETGATLDEDLHLAVKRKVQGLEGRARPLDPPRAIDPPAPVLREGSAAEAGMKPDVAETLRAHCARWADDSGEPFTVLVARNGVIVLHEAFGKDATTGQPIGLDYRADVASITKSVTGILFSRFLDQGRVGLDDLVSVVFPDWPGDPSRVPSFRQCFLHMAGLSGHGDWGGARNPQFENYILNAIDANVAGKVYEYSGNGYELAGKAMELLAGQTLRRLYQDDLFGPLDLDDVPMSAASMGAMLTARELATLGQWVVNRGSYGGRQYIRKETFETLMPEPYSKRYPGVPDEGGIGLHWKRFPLPGKPADTADPAEQLFGPHTLGHGSLSMCVFLADLDNRLVIVQIRKTGGPKHGEYFPGFLKLIAEGLVRD